jgi:hypothetical protein
VSARPPLDAAYPIQFAAKLRTEPINKYILDFPPEHNTDVEWAAKFMRQKFIDLYRPRGAGRQLYSCDYGRAARFRTDAFGEGT